MEHALSEIVSGVYVGTAAAAADADLLREHGIRHVISLLDDHDEEIALPGVKYMRFNIYDDGPARTTNADIIEVCENVYSILARNMDRAEPRKILVHCWSGVSRSVCAVAYFLRKYELVDSVDAAIEHVRAKRAPINIKPQPYFVERIKKELDEAQR